jgi:hypothetical protein
MNILTNPRAKRSYNVKLEDLAVFLEIPDTHDILYNELEMLKCTYQKQFQDQKKIREQYHKKNAKLIPLNLNAFEWLSAPDQIHTFIEDFLKYPSVQEVMMSYFYGVVKPLIGKDAHKDLNEQEESCSHKSPAHKPSVPDYDGDSA